MSADAVVSQRCALSTLSDDLMLRILSFVSFEKELMTVCKRISRLYLQSPLMLSAEVEKALRYPFHTDEPASVLHRWAAEAEEEELCGAGDAPVSDLSGPVLYLRTERDVVDLYNLSPDILLWLYVRVIVVKLNGPESPDLLDFPGMLLAIIARCRNCRTLCIRWQQQWRWACTSGTSGHTFPSLKRICVTFIRSEGSWGGATASALFSDILRPLIVGTATTCATALECCECDFSLVFPMAFATTGETGRDSARTSAFSSPLQQLLADLQRCPEAISQLEELRLCCNGTELWKQLSYGWQTCAAYNGVRRLHLETTHRDHLSPETVSGWLAGFAQLRELYLGEFLFSGPAAGSDESPSFASQRVGVVHMACRGRPQLSLGCVRFLRWLLGGFEAVRTLQFSRVDVPLSLLESVVAPAFRGRVTALCIGNGTVVGDTGVPVPFDRVKRLLFPS